MGRLFFCPQVGEIYKKARAKGVNDLNGLLFELGQGLSSPFDMGDAFVGPWDVANTVSDLVKMMMRMMSVMVGGDM